MYFHVFGGSALLHVLAGYPRLILLFGIAGTIAMADAPHGPGRYIGTGQYLEQLDAVIRATGPTNEEIRTRMLREASNMLETSRRDQIEAAVEYTLRQCGPGCTDLATPIVLGNEDLLKRVLMLYELDQTAAASRADRAAATRPRASGTSTQ